MDESRLAINIAGRSLTGLVSPLDWDQSAPLMFLWAERVMTRLFGVNELALRALPVVAGVALLALAYPLLSSLLGRGATVLGMAILAASPAMVAYSNEVKQYMLEALVAVVLVRLTLNAIARPAEQVAPLLIGGGALSVWMSGSAILMLAGIWPALFHSRDHTVQVARRSVAWTGLLWVVSSGAAYLIVYRSASASSYMARFWDSAFLTPSAGGVGRSWAALKDVVWGFMVGHSGLPRHHEADLYASACVVIGVILVGVGARRLARIYGTATMMVLLGPLAATLLASALRLYPAAHRLLVFAVPLVLIMGLAGLEAGMLHLTDRRRWFAWRVTSGLVVFPLVAVTVLQMTWLDSGSRVRDLIADLNFRRAQGEPVYVFSRLLPVWEFYTTDWQALDTARLAFFNRVGRSDGAAFENSPTRGRPVLPDEGAELVYRSPRGPELIGIPTGMEYLALRGLIQRRPDPGWAGREAERVREVAAPAVWIVMAEFLGPEYELVEQLTRSGGRVTYGRIKPGHVLVRLEFN